MFTDDEPDLSFLERSIQAGVFLDTVNDMVRFLEADVNYATHVIAGLASKQDADLSVNLLTLLLRELADIGDGISILVSKSSHRGAVTLCRSMFELTLSILYVCEQDSVLRSRCYLFDKLRNELEACDYIIDKKETGKEMLDYERAVVEKHYERCKGDRGQIVSRINKDYEDINAEYESVKKRPRKIRHPSWFTLFEGPASIKKLASKFNLLAYYESVYVSESRIVHGKAATDFFEHRNGQASILPIRRTSHLNQPVSTCHMLFSMSMDAIVHAIFPEQSHAHDLWRVSTIGKAEYIRNLVFIEPDDLNSE